MRTAEVLLFAASMLWPWLPGWVVDALPQRPPYRAQPIARRAAQAPVGAAVVNGGPYEMLINPHDLGPTADTTITLNEGIITIKETK